MDNARPHIVDNKEASIKTVQQKHPSVKIIHQPPNSLETNPLDEGIFKYFLMPSKMGIQPQKKI